MAGMMQWPELLCMVCGLPKFDGPDSGYVDEYGDMWTYCKDCDEWTSHAAAQWNPGYINP